MADRERPNVLLITTDQQFAGAMSCAGDPNLNTPAMDRLAADGVRFDAAYTANPVCVASRTSYMTGQPSHVTGVFTNIHAGAAPVNQPCLAQVFRDHGYSTAHFGKWHLPRPLEDQAWSGFDHLAAMANNGVDAQVEREAAAFIRDARRPFFIVASFVNPHDICQWARRLSGHDDRLPDGEIGTPPPPGQCPPIRLNHAICEGEPPAIREHIFDAGMTSAYTPRDWPMNDPRWRQYLWGYHRMVEKVDAHIGQVLAALDAAGVTENTAIVFSSDHGDAMSSHRCNQKTHFFEETARVPFIVSQRGRTTAGICNDTHLVNMGTDLFPTLFGMAGIETPKHLPGLSAARVALGEVVAADRPYIVSQTHHHHGYGNPGEVHGRMIRSAWHKYICYTHGEPREQLFDLQADPGELHDLRHHGGADDVLNTHRAMLCEYAKENGDWFPCVSPR